MVSMRYFIYFLTVFLCLLPASVWATASDWHEQEEVKARLILGDWNEDKTARYGAFQFELTNNWKAYWKIPGDGGLPPEADFEASENVQSVEILWPTPERFIQYDTIESYGYKDRLILPLLITPENTDAPINVDTKVRYGLCDEICIFIDNVFSARIAPDERSEHQALITQGLAKVPEPNNTIGITIDTPEIQEDGTSISVKVTSERIPFTDPDIFVDLSDNFRFPKPNYRLSQDEMSAFFILPSESLLADATLEGKQATLTLVDEGIRTEATFTLQPASATPATQPNGVKTNAGAADLSALPFTTILLFAFLGGLILNVMPCVLPVLSIKVMGFLGSREKSTRDIRSGFLLSALGIVVSFVVLAAIVLFLKASGEAVGWGFHFQEPLFVISIIVIINLFAFSQFDWYHLQLPGWLGGKINKNIDSHGDHSPMGHFLTGAFATLLATPCTAPFLGTAVSFALSGSTNDILILFTVMGLGLATPYLLFATFPKLMHAMPRPGAWMNTVKHVLGVLLLSTSVWLIWVLSQQVTQPYFMILTVLSFIPPLVYWPKLPSQAKLAVSLVAIALIIVMPKPSESVIAEREALWIPLDIPRIEQEVAMGNLVFVDVTASWCITCKFNKANVLSREEVVAALSADNVIAMVGDFTQPVPEIQAYLERHNRHGIPFNIVYGPGNPEGIALPELLTKGAVLDALEAVR